MSTLAIPYTFNTTALRLAATWTNLEKGMLVDDLENGSTYMVIAAGSGAACFTAMPSRYGYILFPLNIFREVTSGGDVGNLAAHGGILASDSTPILRGNAAEMPEIAWASSNGDIIAADMPVPDDFDGTQDVTVMLRTSSGGTTNAATLTVETGWDGGTLVSDTATGAAATAVGAANATVAAADVPDAPKHLQVMLTPAAHTTDEMILHSCKVRYVRK